MMDVPITEGGEISLNEEYEECEGKRRRLMKLRSVVDWVEDAKSDTDTADLLSQELVIRLSNTPRSVGDPALVDHECIVASSIDDKGKVGRLFTLDDIMFELSNLRRQQQVQQQQQQVQQQQLLQLAAPVSFIAQGLSEPVVCAEAFKILEKDFTSVLKDLCHMRENDDVVEDATGIVLEAAKRQNWSISSSDWVDSISFGVFAEAVLLVNTADFNSIAVREKDLKRLCDLKDKLTEIFWDALKEGITALEENDLYSEDLYPELDDAITFLKNRLNLLEILNEWIANSYLRTSRNSVSHPFSISASNDLKAAAMKYYDMILRSTYSEKFRHVGELSKLKLMLMGSSEKRSPRGVGTDGTMLALRALCANANEETRVELDSSDSNIFE